MQEYPAAKGYGKVLNASQANFINDQDDIVLVYFVDIRVVRIEDGRLRFFLKNSGYQALHSWKWAGSGTTDT